MDVEWEPGLFVAHLYVARRVQWCLLCEMCLRGVDFDGDDGAAHYCYVSSAPLIVTRCQLHSQLLHMI